MRGKSLIAWSAVLSIVISVGASTAQSATISPYGEIKKVASSVVDSEGKTYTIVNHLTESATAPSSDVRREYLLVWTGDQSAADHRGHEVPPALPDSLGGEVPSEDFLAVVDVTEGTPTYGDVVNTVTIPGLSNEPHHMQYVWHKGDQVFAGTLYTDFVYVFDVKNVPQISLAGVVTPTETPCGSVPDAFWTLPNGNAIGTFMGGPSNPQLGAQCRYTNGETRYHNGFAGSPGSVVQIDREGNVVEETPASFPEDHAVRTSETTKKACTNNQPIITPNGERPTCANPHGIQARPDLGIAVTSDYAEPRNVPTNPIRVGEITPNVYRPTVRTHTLTRAADGSFTTRLKSVAYLPDGPRKEEIPLHEENMAVMETSVTNEPGNKGAFASAMCGGGLYYTADITAEQPQWRLVYDTTHALRTALPDYPDDGGCQGNGWLQTSPNDRYLYTAIIGRGHSNNEGDHSLNSPGLLVAIDIRKLIAAGSDYKCEISVIAESYGGGQEPDCPTLADVEVIEDETSGGPHWGALDNFELRGDGFLHDITREAKQNDSSASEPDRAAIVNYFVAGSGLDGNHVVNMFDLTSNGQITPDTTFRDEFTNEIGVDFDREVWPHGATGPAKPHANLFVAADRVVR